MIHGNCGKQPKHTIDASIKSKIWDIWNMPELEECNFIHFQEILEEDFLLLNADAIFDIDFNRFVAYHKEKGGLVTLFTHPNSHPYDSGIVITDANESIAGSKYSLPFCVIVQTSFAIPVITSVTSPSF